MDNSCGASIWITILKHTVLLVYSSRDYVRVVLALLSEPLRNGEGLKNWLKHENAESNEDYGQLGGNLIRSPTIRIGD